MAVERVPNAEFNKVYSLVLDTLGSGLALEFDKPNQYKQINQITLCAISNVTGGFVNGTDQIFVCYQIIKGQITTFLANTPPIPNPFPAVGSNPYDGQLIEYAFKNTSLGDNPHIDYNPPLLFDSNQMVTVFINNGFLESVGTQTDITVTVTVLGEYIPQRNANLTKEVYLNPKLK